MKKTKIWMNKKLMDIDKAKISIFDRGFLYGDGLFETMRGYSGVVFKLDEHLDRLYGSMKKIKIKAPYSKSYMKDVIYGLLETNSLKNAYIRIAVTRGEGYFGMTHRDALYPNVVIIEKEFEGYPSYMYTAGIKAQTARYRQNELSPLSGIKSTSFLNYILARLEAEEDGADEAVLLNTKGHVAEAATSNIFIVKGERLITPSLGSGILPGIARCVVLDIARRLKLRAHEKAVLPRELGSADEIFLTNSLAEVLPVTELDSKRVGDGKPGELTRLLHISYQKEVIRAVLR